MAKVQHRTIKAQIVTAASSGTDCQPISSVVWVDRNQLHANDYNPNHVAPAELRLLKTSILSDGWTQPIVARDDGEIVDGFHRWLVSGDHEIAALTDSRVPVVYLVVGDRGHQMMSTIRHNRARGTHHVVKMSDIVRALLDEANLDRDYVKSLLQMDEEEVDRLYERGEMLKRAGQSPSFSKGWVPQ